MTPRYPLLLLALLTILAPATASGQTTADDGPGVVSVDLGQEGKPISADLHGIFFEDLNFAADGGLYAELVENRSFEFSSADRRGWDALTGWKLVERDGGRGEVVVEANQPLHSNNPHYAVLGVVNGEGEVGVENGGYHGLAVTEGDAYDFSVFARQVAGAGGPLVVLLESAAGDELARLELAAPSGAWTKLSGELAPNATVDDARLVVLSRGVGRVALDMISLFPRDTFHGRKNGLRKDLAQAIADLEPKFVRFPGGCLVHGDGLDNMYRWQDTIGPVHERRSQRNIWRYHQSLGLGYFEYFQFCEDIGAKPVPVVPAGVCCQNAGASVTRKWGQGQRGIPLDEMPAYTEEVLDLIEFANGPADSRWGAKRAAMGHPEPFGLEYLGVGNEDHITPEFEERFRQIHDAVTAAHPEIVVIGTVGPAPDGPDYEEGWRIANQLKVAMVDEHYYRPPNWFHDNLQRYDSYDRARSAVYLGEYAAHDDRRRRTLRAALAEAAYLTHLERNADIVRLASYAPLLGKIGHTQWDPNLIYFTNREVRLTPSYHVQRMFSNTSGDIYLACESELPLSVVRDSGSGQVFLKLVNATDADRRLSLELAGWETFASAARVKTLAPAADGPPLPRESTLDLSDAIDYTAPASSLTVIELSR
ncbi:Extracellular exo-alpha-L-arabinofuranosidase precursor [Posidoniimonas corsicana]|uniref:non-reducing end alpha-L-arabinofuranosidase n=1 Tax=Posidoniimonas corsicana TaxID=1938618 RepID=A0A5C5VEE4_9BACT|nr:alpha-L-arabinofuranosidase C-terminal domain-containing protein [Posidoniimonas corsicana]TWT37004.1 Extracellular exo-alpha-L-arabinofuranosidase precursor [Posidoniimonas corsicana]